jgi:hypothetical protein
MSMSSSMTGADPAYGGAANVESSRSAVSWGAIFSGAVAALSITLVLVALGAGLGLTAISPWPNSNPTATKFALTTAIGLIVVQWLSACVGGYMAGRLRTKWVGVHTHEVFFRDTAHGFLAWALASVAGAMFLASAGASIVGGSMHAAAGIAAGGAQGAAHGAASQDMSRVTPYDVDSLFRSDHPEQGTPDTSTAQATHILAAGFANGDVPSADRDYLAQLVATRTGLAQPDARKRVDDVVGRMNAASTKMREDADAARKASAKLAIFTALSMMIGAFIASAAAAYGGNLRDENEEIWSRAR